MKGSLTVCGVTACVSNYGRVGRMGNNHDNNYENNHGSNTVIRDQLWHWSWVNSTVAKTTNVNFSSGIYTINYSQHVTIYLISLFIQFTLSILSYISFCLRVVFYMWPLMNSASVFYIWIWRFFNLIQSFYLLYDC